MLRERLNISGDGLGQQNWDQDSEYVYDLYYQEMVTPGWIQDILSVRAYADEGELVRGWRDLFFECNSWAYWGVAVVCNRCRTSWSMRRRCTMTRMMKTMKQTGGTTTLMSVTQTVTKRNVMVVCIYVMFRPTQFTHAYKRLVEQKIVIFWFCYQ